MELGFDPNAVEDPNIDVFVGTDGVFEVPPKADPKAFVVVWENGVVLLLPVVVANIVVLGVGDPNTVFTPGVATEPKIEGCTEAVVVTDEPKIEPWLTDP